MPRTSNHRRPLGGGRGSRRGSGGRPANANPFTAESVWVGFDVYLSARDASSVGQWNDIGPNGYHATATAKPTYNATGLGGAYPALVFDGVDDFMVTPPLAALAGAAGITVFMVCADATTASRYMLEYGASGGTAAAPGSFAMLCNHTNAGSLSVFSYGNVGQNIQRGAASSEDLATHKVLSFSINFAAAGASETSAVRSNGAALSGSQIGTANNTGTFASYALGINAQTTGANFSNLRLGALYIVGRAMSDAEKLTYERWLGDRFGLPFDDVMATRTVPRILWAGQSNSMGQLESYTVIEAYDGPHTKPRIWAYKDFYSGGWNTSDWTALTESPGLGYEGPDLVTCIDLVRNYNLAPELIMCAQGATSVAVDWNPSTGTTYARLVDTTYPTATDGTHPAPPASFVPWIVWIQGENDASSGAYAAAYDVNLPAFFAALETDIPDFADCKIALVQLHIDSRNGSADATTVGQVRSAQQAFAAANPDRVFLIDVDDLSLQVDNVHYTEATAIEVGKRIAAVIGANTP